MTDTAHDDSGLAAAAEFYEQGGVPTPIEHPTPTRVELRVRVAGTIAAKVLANDLTAQLVAHPDVRDVEITVTDEPAAGVV